MNTWSKPVRAVLVCSVVALCQTSAFAEEPATHWAFRPVSAPAVPAVQTEAWIRNPIDAFVLSRLEREGLTPSPETEKSTLLRRLSLDLTGLPPSLDDLQAFERATDESAYAREVDRLLASPHFGEKWARWWLDLSGYADSDGYLSDFLRPNAWRYRQWVIDSLNADKPFDQFTVEQLAGDLLPNATTEQRVGTGFLRNTLNNREGGADLEEFRVRQVVARTSMVGTAWLGLTVGCAECHDHKFDPISQVEFFRLYAFLNSADEVNTEAPLPGQAEAYAAARAEYDRKRSEILGPAIVHLTPLFEEWEAKLIESANAGEHADPHWARAWEVLGLVWGQNYGEGQHEGLRILKTPLAERSQFDQDRLFDYFLRNGSMVNETQFAELRVGELVKSLDELDKQLPPISRAPTMAQMREARITRVHRRGDFRSPGGEVAPGTPAVLPALNVASPTRLDMAQWLVRADNPLTPRVTANRVWQEIFGRGLVFTSEDFGVRSSPPTHPELLDWLSLRLMEQRWSLKVFIKDIVMSATYRQSSHRRAELNERDPNNELLARQTRVRLSAELVRDTALSASGLLNATIGGPSVRPPQPESVTKEGFDNLWIPSEGVDRYRRGIYTFLQRTSPFGQFVTFDLPDTARPCTRRDRSNTPLQALNLLNDPVFVDAARSLAQRTQAYALRRIGESNPPSTDECIAYAFRLCVSREPNAEETARLKAYLTQQTALYANANDAAATLAGLQAPSADAVEPAAWVALCSVLLNLDEFITKE